MSLMPLETTLGPPVAAFTTLVGPDLGRTALGRLLVDAVAALDRDRELARLSLARALALLEVEHRDPPPTPAGLAPWQVKKALAHIDGTLEGPLKISDLAKAVRLSPSYFSRAFKVSLGAPPQKFIQQRRIAQAQTLMLTTNDPLSQIANACGFSDQAHFSRIFHRSAGIPPNAWRRARRNLMGALDRSAVLATA